MIGARCLHRASLPKVVRGGQRAISDYNEYSEEPRGISSATDALAKSCYFKIDFKIGEESSVYEAIQRFAAYNIGALAVADSAGRVTGIVSERDYVCKVALLGRQSQNTKIKEVATMGPNVVMAKKSDTVQDCMKKMLSRDIRHLPIIDDDSGEVVGLLSIKDLIKEVAREKENLIHKISDFKLGKGGFLDHGI